ncbi:MAG: MFS transporter [Candidatus Marinimicrobia bacterium]|nr:MFS transporter [Candidatus Neomarinimicrobiota bacterium]
MEKLSKSIKNNPMYRYLTLLVVVATVGHQAWRTLLNNFAVDQIGLNGLQMGLVQSLREVPGFLTFLVVYVLLIFKEHRFSAFSIILFGAGIIMTGLFPSFQGLLFTTFLMSLGFHYFETTRQSLVLQYFNKRQSPLVLAKWRSLSAIANIGIGAAIWVLFRFTDISMSVVYTVLGVAIIGFGIYSTTKDPADKELPVQHKKIIIRKKYWLFYALNFLSGARRQIFVVFAVFMLVQKYNFTVWEISTLFVLNNLITWLVSPLIGKAINRFGERKILTLEYVFLIIIFLGYALFEIKVIAVGLYVIDHIFFNFSIGIHTFFQKMADPKDIAPSMAVSFSINHISAVIIPAIGGMLWMLNWQIPFIFGSALAVVSLILVQLIRVPVGDSMQEVEE